MGLNPLSDQKRPASFRALHERKTEAVFMWRTADHKPILRMKHGTDDDTSKYRAADISGGEFYDLVKDPLEWNDLYSTPAAQRERREKMTGELLAFLKSHRKLTDFRQRKR